MRIVVDLRAVDRGVDDADGLLSEPTDSRRVREARARLEAVDALLARLVSDDTVNLNLAARLECIRDDLGGHLLAAAAMDEMDVAPQKVANVLRRGAAAARVRVAQITEDEVTTPAR